VERAQQVGGEAGTVWNLVKGVRRTRRGGEVVSFTHSYIPNRLSRYMKSLPGCVGPFYAHLARLSREEILEADQQISGEKMDAEVAKYLGCKRGEIAICALRRYTSAKGAIITSFNWHVAEKFSFQMKLQKNL